MHDARDVVLPQGAGTARRIAADGAPRLRRDGASVVEVARPAGPPRLKLDARGAWARKGAPILSVLSVDDRRPGSARPGWLSVGGGDSLRFHYPGTHGEVRTAGACPCASTAARAAIRGRSSASRRPPLAWAIGAGLAVAAGAAWCSACRRGGVRLRPRRRAWRSRPSRPLRRERGHRRRGPGARSSPRVVALAGLAAAIRLRRDAALEQGVLAVRRRSCSRCRWSAASQCCATA